MLRSCLLSCLGLCLIKSLCNIVSAIQLSFLSYPYRLFTVIVVFSFTTTPGFHRFTLVVPRILQGQQLIGSLHFLDKCLESINISFSRLRTLRADLIDRLHKTIPVQHWVLGRGGFITLVGRGLLTYTADLHTFLSENSSTISKCPTSPGLIYAPRLS